MKYQVGETGRVVVVRFEHEDNIWQGLGEIAKKENIRAGVFYLVGGMQAGRFVVGPEKEEIPPTPIWRELNESHEVVGLGTIFWQGDEPKIHFHGAYGKRDNVKVVNTVDPGLLMGLTIKFHDYYFDLSLKGRLNQVFESLQT